MGTCEMSILVFLVPLALLLGGFFVVCFLWSLKNGQCDDLETPKYRAILDVAFDNKTDQEEK